MASRSEHARGPRGVVVELGGAAGSGQCSEGGEHRRHVLADIVPARVDEVALAQAQPFHDGPCPRVRSVLGERRRPDRVRGPGRQRHDPDAIAPQVQQSSRGATDSVARHEDGRGIAQEPASEPLAESRGGSPLEGAGQLPRCEIEQRGDRGEVRGDRQATARGVIDGARRAARLGPPGGPDRRATQEERIDRERRGAQQPDGGQEPTADHVEVLEAHGRVVLVARQQEGERLAGQRVGIERAEQALQIGRRPRRASRFLECPHVHDDAQAGRSRHVLRRNVPKRRPDLLQPELHHDHECLDHDPP